ncbi:MAG TPA: monovalent cation/H+ antiporter subunit D family protein, partial [Actinoplanes sp.]|nr:monovalent cation/H+ antiporter subunit D family protein [Actinoplanes sp.]
MTALLILPVALPMVVAGLLLALPHRALLHRTAGIATAATSAATGLALLTQTSDGQVLVQHVGGWPAGTAISLAADTFSALMLTVTALVTAACLVFASAAGDDRHTWFVPLALLMSAGAHGAFLAADLFNLFVLVEVMLVPSYALLAWTGGRRRIRAARVYLTVNLMAST